MTELHVSLIFIESFVYNSVITCALAELYFYSRINEMFEIIVDYPESQPALKDLALCLERVDVKDKLILSLYERFANLNIYFVITLFYSN